MFLKFLNNFIILNDAPKPWQIGFQDSATPTMEGIVELHDQILFYLIIILIFITWILSSIFYQYSSSKNLLKYKYENHGINVPIQKYSKFIYIRSYTTKSIAIKNKENNDCSFVVKYEDAYLMKKKIFIENEGKSGIYMLTNKLTNDIYIGQSVNISKRLKKYFNFSYIKSKDSFIISRALIKYGYSNFIVTILEYCDKSDLLNREQFYFDKLNPQYNILKIAGSSLNFKHSEKTKTKISKALKGIYVKEKSALFGRFHTEKTKNLMSLKKVKENNPLFGKVHSEKSKELMRQSALGRKHSEETKLKMSIKHGNPVNIYEKCSSEGFKFIGSFVSTRKTANFLDISKSTVIKYMNSGKIFKDRYKFSSA
jgi:group I intron endonuclease